MRKLCIIKGYIDLPIFSKHQRWIHGVSRGITEYNIGGQGSLWKLGINFEVLTGMAGTPSTSYYRSEEWITPVWTNATFNTNNGNEGNPYLVLAQSSDDSPVKRGEGLLQRLQRGIRLLYDRILPRPEWSDSWWFGSSSQARAFGSASAMTLRRIIKVHGFYLVGWPSSLNAMSYLDALGWERSSCYQRELLSVAWCRESVKCICWGSPSAADFWLAP